MDIPPTVCGGCGCQSTLAVAFKSAYSFKGPVPLCPRCVERRRRRRANAVLLGALVVLIGVPVLWAIGIEHDVLWLLALVAGFQLSKLISILPHEWGHAFAAKMVGYRPVAIIWGNTEALFDFRWFGIRTRIGHAPDSAVTYFEPLGERAQRVKHIVVTAAGVTVNILLGFAAVWCAARISQPMYESIPKAMLLVFGVANFAMAFANLWPASVNTVAGRISNDGLRLFELMVRGPPDALQCRASASAIRMHLAWEDGEFDRAMTELDAAESLLGPTAWIDSARGAGWCRLGKPQVARALLENSLRKEDVDPATRALLNNNLAWALFISDDAALDEQSRDASSRAYGVLPWFAPVVITRACSLAAHACPGSERLEQATKLLERLPTLEMSKDSRQFAAVAAGLVAAARGNFREARHQLRIAQCFGDPGLAGRFLEARLPSN